MKWFLIGFVCLVCSATWVRGDAAADPAANLYNQGITALQAQKYADAAQAFDRFLASYPTNPNIDNARIRAGLAHLYAGNFSEAVDRLSKPAADKTKPDYQATALYFTSLAQFSQGQKSNNKNLYGQAVKTLTALINLITTAPTPDNKGYLEQAVYYRALAHFLKSDYADAEKDLKELTQSPQFSGSLSRPDYLLLLGNLYKVETNQAVTDKKPADVIRSLADKALAVFNAVSTDPNALVQANAANMGQADVLLMIAPLDSTSAGYEKALEAYRLVRRKDEMIPRQQNRLDELRRKSQEANQQNSAASLANENSLLITREENQLADLQNGPDPIIQALIRMGECYISITRPDGTHESDEARTILHRLIAHAKLTPDQQKEVDFQILYSYVLGGQTDQADKALTDYLSKHSGDPNADSISYQIAAKLLERQDYAGALNQADRSLRDFPPGKGTYAADAITVKAQALTGLGRTAEANSLVDNFLKEHPTSPQANSLLLSRAENETHAENFAAALADYQKVKDNQAAGPELQSAADDGYIQTLNSLQRFDDVIKEAKAFATQYPASPALPTVQLMASLALEQTHDPGAVAALQDVARKFPKDEVSPFALYDVVDIYHQAKNTALMIQAANDLRKAYPEAYALLLQAADVVSEVSLKQKKFDDAVALYQPLTEALKPEVAALARNKIGAIWVAAARALGAYQSMPLDTRAEAEKRLSAAEQAYLGTLKTFPDQLDAVGDAFDGLVTTVKQRRSWGLLKDADLEGQLGKLGADFTDHDMQTRFELAGIGLVFDYKNGEPQYPAALDRFKKAIAANPALRLTRQETNQFGELLLAARDYPAALKIYNDLLTNAAPDDEPALGDGYYGVGATYFGQGNLPQAKEYFLKLEGLKDRGAWHPHIMDASYGIARADEQSGQPADINEARQIYAQLMRAQPPQGSTMLQAKAMLGFGRLLEKSGNALKPTAVGLNEYAVHYYQEPNLLFSLAVPDLSAEGLFDAGQAYERAGDKANAKKEYDELLRTYSTTAPDWAAKAQAADDKLAL